MRKIFLILCFILALLFSTGCNNDSENIGSVISDEVSAIYTVLETTDGYEVSKINDQSAVGIFTDYHKLKYFDDKGNIQLGHILIAHNKNGSYCVSALTLSGVRLPNPLHLERVDGGKLLRTRR